jgi:hypothetical protein
MQRVELGANPAWRAAMYAHAVHTAFAMKFFTADDVFRRAVASGMTETTSDKRAFGPVMLQMAKHGFCRKAHRLSINSQRVSRHASPLTVWESLIYELFR